MDKKLRVVIVGGVACGPKAASRIKRLLPDSEVTMIDRGGLISYGACGLPYYVEGAFPEIAMLTETPAGVVRNAAFFEKVKGFKSRTRTEAVSIDREHKTVRARNVETGSEEDIPYDKLVLATGSRPIRPPIPGLELKNVWTMRHPDDAESMVDRIEADGLKRAVLIGAGYIGVEMAEALRRRGLDVTIVEMFDQIMPQFLDSEIALLAARHMRQKGVELALGEQVLAIEGNGKAASVRTDKRDIPADLVVIGAGVRPNDELAREAGLDCAPKGGIVINEFCQTSHPDIYAGGDCVVNRHADHTIQQFFFVPLGSTSNKHGRVIADHIAGKSSPFKGITSTGICRAFDFTIGRTGLSEKQAKDLYPDVETSIWAGLDMPHYIPQSKPLIIKMSASKTSRKLLGVQIVGTGDAAKRLEVAASALHFGATVDDIGNIDLGYAPPFSSPIDPIVTAAHVLANKLDGIAKGLSPLSVKQRLDNGDDFICSMFEHRSSENNAFPLRKRGPYPSRNTKGEGPRVTQRQGHRGVLQSQHARIRSATDSQCRRIRTGMVPGRRAGCLAV